MIRNVYRCPVCGGANVSARAWVNPNFLSKRPSDVSWLDEPDVFCADCQEDVRGWDITALEFDRRGLVVTGDGEHITLDEWCKRDRTDQEGSE